MSGRHPAEWILLAGLVPLWIAAGLADWACHRRTAIHATSGLPENLFHWLLMAQGGVALLAAVLLETTAGVLAIVAGAFLLHEATTYAELRYAVPRREVRPAEQMVHSVMEMMPLAMLALLAVVLLSDGTGATADFGLRWKAQPWPTGVLLALGAGVLMLNVAPLAEESLRCLRHRKQRTAA